MRVQPWVFIDVSFIAHRARYAMKGLQFDDAPTGVMFGFFEQIKTICSDPRILSTKVILCFDSRKSFRKEEFPDYKARRHDNRTEEEKQEIIMMHEQLAKLREGWLPASGFKTCMQDGLESDDLMAMGARQMKKRGIPGVMVTADHDLYQAINEYAHWFNPDRKAQEAYLNRDGFKNLMGISPPHWKAVKCLSGCRGDGVPGIPGIGDATAIKWVANTLPRDSAKYRAIEEGVKAGVVVRNRPLVCLPRGETQQLDLTFPTYDADSFFDYCKRYGLNSYLDGGKKHFWQSFFRGNITSTVQVPRKRGERRD